MFIITDYVLLHNEKDDFFYVKSNDVVPPCPVCHGCMRYRDAKKRGMKLEGGSRQWLIIHRFKCCSCGRLHNELPDCLVPYKHYQTEIISGVLDGVCTPDDLECEDYPCIDTMLLWLKWFSLNLQRIEGFLRRALYKVSCIREGFSHDRTLDLCQYFGHKKLNFSPSIAYAERFISYTARASSSTCCGVL